MSETLRVCLWSGPRNVSTALMYAFAQRDDTAVFDEPLYAHYLVSTDARTYHPGAEEVLASQDNDGQAVVANLILAKHAKPVLFFKHMTHHLVNLDRAFLDQTVNVLLTRDPREMLPSYAACVEAPSLADVGYKQHCELLEYLHERGQTPAVLDAKQLLVNPRNVLTRLCEHIGIRFQEAMLKWPAGPRPEDGVWAKYWYSAVHLSTQWAAYAPKSDPFPSRLEPLLATCQPYYERLRALAIQA